MKRYLVSWTIDFWANSADEAAEEALRIQRDPNSIATVFRVRDMENNNVCMVDPAIPKQEAA